MFWTRLLSTQNIRKTDGYWVRKYLQFNAQKFCSSKSVTGPQLVTV